jgi:hypothetical protein
MPKLEYLMKGMDSIKTDLDEADHVKSNMDSMLEKRFGAINKNIESALKDLVRQGSDSQAVAFNSAVQQAMLQLTQTQQLLMNSLAKISTAPDEAKEAICADIDKLATRTAKGDLTISKQINDVTADIKKSIKAIPVPKPCLNQPI